MQINEIFGSIDGEGSRTGYLTTFIRSQYCNLRCVYCDTKYSWDAVDENNCKQYTDMTVQEIVDKCKELGNRRITFTGGEPLIQKDAAELVVALIKNGFEVNIETNGAVELSKFNELVEDLYGSICKSLPLFYTLDYKCPTSGMQDKMILDNLEFIGPDDVLKFVVGSEEDLNAMLYILNNYNITAEVFVSPVYGDIEGKDIVKFMQDHNLQNVRVQVQLHKYFWPVDMRGV